MEEDLSDDYLEEIAAQAENEFIANNPKSEHLMCLSNFFGHQQFRPNQWQIIRSLMEEKKDNCVIMPTGYGKSLLFQFAAVYQQKIALVVSPLISLMQEQVMSLSVANIPACFLGSAQKNRNIFSEIKNGSYRVVYASPEYLSSDIGQDLVKQICKNLTVIAIDEAHCVSQWGHDFRTQYRHLGELREFAPNVPILAVTATATNIVCNDIVTNLRMRNSKIICMGFDRPNIEFNVIEKGKTVWDDLRRFVVKTKGSVIVYVLKKADAEEIASIINENGVHCEFYHAGTSLKKRKEILEDFTRDRLRLIIATIAFGMGIDKPDVRFVIHYGASRNIESYYQEVGRAGRDGQPSKAIMFYSKKDFNFHEWMIDEDVQKNKKSVYSHMRNILHKMRDFCYTTQCRRKFILEYFDSKVSSTTSNESCCDNCRNGSSSKQLSDVYNEVDNDGNFDFTENALLFLRTMELTNRKTLAIAVLRGSGTKDTLRYVEHDLFAKGKLFPKEYWDLLVQQLQRNEYLQVKRLPPPFKSTVELSQKACDWMQNTPIKSLVLKVIPEMLKYMPRKRKHRPDMKTDVVVAGTSSSSSSKSIETIKCVDKSKDKDLENILIAIRSILAEHFDCPPFTIASNAAIEQMIKMKAKTIDEFKSTAFDGFSLAKIEKFAKYFIDGIVKFQNEEFDMEKLLKENPIEETSMTSTDQKLFNCILGDLSIEEIEIMLELDNKTIIDKMIQIIRSGKIITKKHLKNLINIKDEIINYVKTRITFSDYEKIKMNELSISLFTSNTNISENQFLLAMEYWNIRWHLNALNIIYYDKDQQTFENVNLLLKNNIIEKRNSQPSNSNVNSPSTAHITSLSLPDISKSNNIEDKKSSMVKLSSDTPKSTPSQLQMEESEHMDNTATNINLTEKKMAQKVIDNNNRSESIVDLKSNASKSMNNRKVVNIRVRPKSNVVYDSDSESNDSDGVVKNTQKRHLPVWLTECKHEKTTQSTKKKKKFNI